MNRFSILLLLAAFVLSSCASSSRRHLGTWEATEFHEGKYALTFTEDEKTQVTTPEGTYSGEYIIDYSKRPIHLDVVWKDQTVKCLMEFLGKDSFRIIGEDDAGKLRPLKFEPEQEVVVFKKTNKKK